MGLCECSHYKSVALWFPLPFLILARLPLASLFMPLSSQSHFPIPIFYFYQPTFVWYSAACFWTLFLVVFSQKEACLNKKHETVKLSNQNQNVTYELLPVCYPCFHRCLHNTTSLSLFFYRMSEAMWSLSNAL